MISLRWKIFIIALLLNGGLAIILDDGTLCSDTAIACADRKKCIEVANLCDYEENCADSSDELNIQLCKGISKLSDRCTQGKIRCSAYGSSHSYLQNECVDIVTACKLGNRCVNDVTFCEEIKQGKLKSPNQNKAKESEMEKLMKFIADSLNKTIQANFSICPPFYALYKEKCISVFTPVQISWSEAKLFCTSTLGTLIVLDGIQEYKDVLDYLKENSISSKFWIGGYMNETFHDTWTWINGPNIEMGAPFWAVTVDTLQTGGRSRTECTFSKELMPRSKEAPQKCLAISDENFYYFSNEECSKKMSPICLAEKIG